MKIVAVIDDGLDYANLKLSAPVIEYEVVEGKVKRTTAKKTDRDSHGMLCASIIDQHCSARILIVSVRVKKDSESDGAIKDLIVAVDFCVKIQVDVMNISLGCTKGLGVLRFKRAIRKAVDVGIVVVSALSNDGKASYPAVIQDVIAVRANVRGIGGRIILVQDSELGEVFETWPEGVLNASSGEKVGYQISNSYACPMITARVAEMIDDGSNQKRVLRTIVELRKQVYIEQKRGFKR